MPHRTHRGVGREKKRKKRGKVFGIKGTAAVYKILYKDIYTNIPMAVLMGLLCVFRMVMIFLFSMLCAALGFSSENLFILLPSLSNSTVYS